MGIKLKVSTSQKLMKLIVVLYVFLFFVLSIVYDKNLVLTISIAVLIAIIALLAIVLKYYCLRCPFCNSSEIAIWSKYCKKCGKKLE